MIPTPKPPLPKPKIGDTLWEGALSFRIQEISCHGYAFIQRPKSGGAAGMKWDCVPFGELEPHIMDGHWSRKSVG